MNAIEKKQRISKGEKVNKKWLGDFGSHFDDTRIKKLLVSDEFSAVPTEHIQKNSDVEILGCPVLATTYDHIFW